MSKISAPIIYKTLIIGLLFDCLIFQITSYNNLAIIFAPYFTVVLSARTYNLTLLSFLTFHTSILQSIAPAYFERSLFFTRTKQHINASLMRFFLAKFLNQSVSLFWKERLAASVNTSNGKRNGQRKATVDVKTEVQPVTSD